MKQPKKPPAAAHRPPPTMLPVIAMGALLVLGIAGVGFILIDVNRRLDETRAAIVKQKDDLALMQKELWKEQKIIEEKIAQLRQELESHEHEPAPPAHPAAPAPPPPPPPEPTPAPPPTLVAPEPEPQVAPTPIAEPATPPMPPQTTTTTKVPTKIVKKKPTRPHKAHKRAHHGKKHAKAKRSVKPCQDARSTASWCGPGQHERQAAH